MPASATRRMESVGPGVWELKEQDERAWYRVMYLSKIDNVIYVLHCFEKRSRKTDKRDLEVAKERLARVRQRIQQQRKGTKDVRKNE
jgi:phage-related protein